MGLFLKDPDAAIDYSVDWSQGYLEGATITASRWTVVPEEAGGLTVTAQLFAPTRTGATIGGGQRGHVYRVTNRVTLNDGRNDERSLAIRIDDR